MQNDLGYTALHVRSKHCPLSADVYLGSVALVFQFVFFCLIRCVSVFVAALMHIAFICSPGNPLAYLSTLHCLLGGANLAGAVNYLWRVVLPPRMAQLQAVSGTFYATYISVCVVCS